MKKAIFFALGLTLCAVPALAQQSATGQSSGGYRGNSANAAGASGYMAGERMMMRKKMMRRHHMKRKMMMRHHRRMNRM